MARKSGDVQIQLVVPASLRRAIHKAAFDHQDDVDRARLMNRGPMITYVMRWFLAMPKADQLNVILAGKAIDDAGKSGGAEKGDEKRRKASSPRPTIQIQADSIDAGTNPIPERPATGGGEIESGGEDFPVGAKKRAPARKKRTS